MSAQYYEGIGRRKSASARVRLFPGGTGQITINGKDGLEYLPRFGDFQTFMSPLAHIGQENLYNFIVYFNVFFISVQRDVILLGIARALEKIDPDLRGQLKGEGFLTRDARVKERKKPGLKRARKAPTYTKR